MPPLARHDNAGMNAWALWVTRQWMHRTWGAWAMWPLHLLLLCLVKGRRLAWRWGWLRSTTLPVPVVVVGNRIVGGAGKTPTTLEVISHLQRGGWRPGLLSRGYGRSKTSAAPVILDDSLASGLNAASVGDEPWLIWQRCKVPVGVHRRRALAGQALLGAHPEIDILVCDDGLQHLALNRDVEIVVFDERGEGNGWLLPAGPLREPIDTPSGTLKGQPPLVLYNAPRATTRLPGHRVHKQLTFPTPWHDWVLGQRTARPHPAPLLQAGASDIWAVAGIAQPDRFFDALEALGIHAVRCPLADHAQLDALPWPPTARHVVMTEKDAVKINPEQVARHSPDTQLWVAALDFTPEPAFWRALDAQLPEPKAR